MRHVYGAGLAIVMAAAVFFAASWAYLRLLRLPGGALPGGGGSLIHNHAVLEGFGVMLAVGLLAGLLIAIPWISPLASGLPGIAMLAWTGLYLFSVRNAVRYIPLKRYDYGAGFEALLFDGVLAAVGLAMIIPMFIPSRWVRHAALPVPAFGPLGPAMADSDLTQPYTPAPDTMADSGLLADWDRTRPQAQIDPGPPPPSQSQPPWDRNEFG
jgi:hypothetical protein